MRLASHSLSDHPAIMLQRALQCCSLIICFFVPKRIQPTHRRNPRTVTLLSGVMDCSVMLTDTPRRSLLTICRQLQHRHFVDGIRRQRLCVVRATNHACEAARPRHCLQCTTAQPNSSDTYICVFKSSFLSSLSTSEPH